MLGQHESSSDGTLRTLWRAGLRAVAAGAYIGVTFEADARKGVSMMRLDFI